MIHRLKAAGPVARLRFLVLPLLCAGGVGACELQLMEHRSGRELLRAPMAGASVSVAFVHSVLGTPVSDRYVWRSDAWHLVAERFEGEGYGLPQLAQAGEQLSRSGTGWLLTTDRRMDPLVLRVAPGTAMRIEMDDGRVWPLDAWTARALRLNAVNCRTPLS